MIERIVKLALSLGADEAEVFHSLSSGYSFSSVGRRIHSREFEAEEGWAVRVIKNGRLGFAFFGRTKEAQKAVRRALALAKFCEQAEYSFPCSGRMARAPCFDKRIAEMQEKEGVEMLQAALDAMQESGAVPTECALEYGGSTEEICNSNGVVASERRTSLACFLACSYDGKSGSASAGSALLDFDVGEVARKAAEHARARRRARRIKRGVRAAVLDAVSLHPFIGMLVPSLNGDRVRRGVSVLAGKLGEQIAHEGLTVWDDPLAHGIEARSFDGEGMPSRKKGLIRDGVLASFLFDIKSACLARKKGISADAGNCTRAGYAAVPGIGASNLVIEGGGERDVIDGVDDGIYVVSIIGEHTANRLTGDYSVSVDLGFAIKDGELAGPVSEGTMAGNIFEMLRNVTAIERKRERHFGLTAPRMAFGGVSFGGK
ncbi:MAG: TldD/PmbA family protein [Candidatus Micrarchaeia archaeon]